MVLNVGGFYFTYTRLLTVELMQTLCIHAAGNYRVLTSMAVELMASAAQQEITQLDEKLYLEVFATPTANARKRAIGVFVHRPTGLGPACVKT